MTNELRKVWMVTGASRGLGQAITMEALESGANVVAGYRKLPSPDPLEKQYGPDRYLAVNLDVTSAEAINGAVNAAIERFGTIDVLVNNAGFSDLSSIEETTLDDFRWQLETNLFGVIACTKAVLPILRKKKGGHIIQIASVAGQVGPPGRGPYAVAKWGVEGFSEVLALETKSFGVKVTIIEPGGFRTDFAARSQGSQTRDVIDDYKPTVGKMIAFQQEYSGKQPGDPKKAAKAIVHVSQMHDPPLRLALGADAYGGIDAKLKERQEEREHYKEISCSMNIDGEDEDDSPSAWKLLSSS